MQIKAFSSATLLLSLFEVCWTNVCLHAAETDNREKINWSASGKSSMKIANDLRIIEMEENVEISQGKILLEGDLAVIEYLVSTGELSKITVEGNPVRYQQQIGLSEDSVSGTSDFLSIHKEASDNAIGPITLITLTGNATLQSPSANMRCAAIIYASELDLVREAEGPCKGQLESQKD